MDDRLQIRVQMTNRQTQEIFWNQVIEYKLSRLGVFDIQEDIAKKLAAAVGEFCRFIKQQAPAGKMAVA
jgi:TolB-like protein